jgi:hypothetical protein
MAAVIIFTGFAGLDFESAAVIRDSLDPRPEVNQNTEDFTTLLRDGIITCDETSARTNFSLLPSPELADR